MPADAYSATEAVWRAPQAAGPLDAVVRLPGSKSLTNRELVLSALASAPSRLRHPLVARDTELMVRALRALGARITEQGDDLVVEPAALVGGVAVDVGLAGTLMRFLPPVAALADGPVRFDGDAGARRRPMATTLRALRGLGVEVDLHDGAERLPFTVVGVGRVRGQRLMIDSSSSSQFVSGLLLAAPRFDEGLALLQDPSAGPVPSTPHVEMTVAALRARGVRVTAEPTSWTVSPGQVLGRDVVIEPDLSNAAPFLAAALVTGGRVSVPDWPDGTTQPGDHLRAVLPEFGAEVRLADGALTVDGGAGVLGGSRLRPVDLELGDHTELVPTLAALAAFADGVSTFRGIGHMRGHETDRLEALARELTAVGARTTETPDGIVVRPGALVAPARPWKSYADHRMATSGALIGLAVEGVAVEDVATTAKTLPGFTRLWAAMLA